ncbi:hypothetical protein P1P68_40995, partial [Streptomyces scabiei]|nr:hypothetical protein [Streptomyces scabiei]
MGAAKRLSFDPSEPVADEPVDAPVLGASLCVGSAETDGDGEPDASEGDGEGDGLREGLAVAAPAPPPGGAG